MTRNRGKGEDLSMSTRFLPKSTFDEAQRNRCERDSVLKAKMALQRL